MNDSDKRICRYFNTLGGCWYGEKCKFIHLLNKKPPCKFFGSSSGCRFGDSCHFSHDRSPFKSVENYENIINDEIKEDFKENMNPNELTGTNNNNMEQNSSAMSTSSESVSNAISGSEVIMTMDYSLKESSVNNEIEVHCGSCKRVLDKQNNESYCNILKDHYLESFLDKEGDHVKYVKFKAALDPGQIYWCKTCIFVFEKPWSLFQHMADKAKGNKVQRWEKKIHLDWLDTVAGVMAGYDLGLFSLGKLRNDLRNLLADQHTIEEEMEAAAIIAAAMMQWLNPVALGIPYRLQKREIIRNMEQLNRQMCRKGGRGMNWGMLTGMGSNNVNVGAQNLHGPSQNLQNTLLPRGTVNNIGNGSSFLNNCLPIEASGDSAELCGIELTQCESNKNEENLKSKADYSCVDDVNPHIRSHECVEKYIHMNVNREWHEHDIDVELKTDWSESFSSV